MGRPKVIHKYICDSCGAHFERLGAKQRRGEHFFCDSHCSAEWRKVAYKGRRFNDTILEWCHKSGEEHPHWKGGFITAQGYKAFQKNNIYYLEHRYVMEQHLGRRLEPTEHIHHINGDKLDNRLENLELFSNAKEHSLKYHSKFCGNQYS